MGGERRAERRAESSGEQSGPWAESRAESGCLCSSPTPRPSRCGEITHRGAARRHHAICSHVRDRDGCNPVIGTDDETDDTAREYNTGMSLAQRVLITWLCALVFLTLLVLKLDGRVTWSWFVVFAPVWTLDGALLLVAAVRMAGRCGGGRERAAGGEGLQRGAWHVLALALKLAFCVCVCARLHGLLESTLCVYVCVPLWTLLTGALVELGLNIFPRRTE